MKRNKAVHFLKAAVYNKNNHLQGKLQFRVHVKGNLCAAQNR